MKVVFICFDFGFEYTNKNINWLINFMFMISKEEIESDIQWLNEFRNNYVDFI